MLREPKKPSNSSFGPQYGDASFATFSTYFLFTNHRFSRKLWNWVCKISNVLKFFLYNRGSMDFCIYVVQSYTLLNSKWLDHGEWISHWWSNLFRCLYDCFFTWKKETRKSAFSSTRYLQFRPPPTFINIIC